MAFSSLAHSGYLMMALIWNFKCHSSSDKRLFGSCFIICLLISFLTGAGLLTAIQSLERTRRANRNQRQLQCSF